MKMNDNTIIIQHRNIHMLSHNYLFIIHGNNWGPGRSKYKGNKHTGINSGGYSTYFSNFKLELVK